MKYTNKQIVEAIKYWQQQLKKMDESGTPNKLVEPDMTQSKNQLISALKILRTNHTPLRKQSIVASVNIVDHDNRNTQRLYDGPQLYLSDISINNKSMIMEFSDKSNSSSITNVQSFADKVFKVVEASTIKRISDLDSIEIKVDPNCMIQDLRDNPKESDGKNVNELCTKGTFVFYRIYCYNDVLAMSLDYNTAAFIEHSNGEQHDKDTRERMANILESDPDEATREKIERIFC